MSGRIVVLVAGALVLKTAALPACDRTQPAKKFCDDFCNYRCGFYNSSVESGKLQNITAYRLTPKNVTGILNKNSGDAPGDVFFYVTHGLSLAEKCAKNPFTPMCLAANVNNNLYGEYIVEMDGQYGPYMQCNAETVKDAKWSNTQTFACGIDCYQALEGKGCTLPVWKKKKRNESRTGDHDTGICWCDGSRRHELTVGREFRKGSAGVSAFPTGHLGGYWYSTPVAGECKNAAPVGTNGCTWRVVKDVKYANASSVDSKVSESVEKYGAKCFDACQQPLNRSSDCYFKCYRHMLQGDGGFEIIPNELIVKPWSDAFKYDDPEVGGCPYVKPDPCKGDQCDPLLPPGHLLSSLFVV